MADYQEMYRKLFQATTKAIDILQKAQQETEELYIASDQPELHLTKDVDSSSRNSEDTAFDNQMGSLGIHSQSEWADPMKKQVPNIDNNESDNQQAKEPLNKWRK
ncbi:MAG: hypothetical protein ABF904_14800 [Ethanoligenens sp.]